MTGECDENSGKCSDFIIHNESSGDKVAILTPPHLQTPVRSPFWLTHLL